MDPVKTKFYTLCVIHRLNKPEGDEVLRQVRATGILTLPENTARQKMGRGGHHDSYMVQEYQVSDEITEFIETARVLGVKIYDLEGDWWIDLTEYEQVWRIASMYGVLSGFPYMREKLLPPYIAILTPEEDWQRIVFELMRARNEYGEDWNLYFWERFAVGAEDFERMTRND